MGNEHSNKPKFDGTFKVKIKDGDGNNTKYITSTAGLDNMNTNAQGFSGKWLSYTCNSTTYYLSVDGNGTVSMSTTSMSWTLDTNNRLSYTDNSTPQKTHYLIHSGTTLSTTTTAPTSGHTVTTELTNLKAKICE